MTNIITNIYKINHESEHLINCDQIRLTDKMICQKKSSFTIYVYKELYLYIDSDGNKKCYRRISLNNTVDSKFFKETYQLLGLPLDNFPFIDKYDQVINQTTYNFSVQSNNKNKVDINLIKESLNNSPDKEISYINLNNDIDIREIISFIE